MSILKSGKTRVTAIIGLVGILASATIGSANAGNYSIGIDLGNGGGLYFSGNSNHKQKGHKKYRKRHGNYYGNHNPYYLPVHKLPPASNYYPQPRRQVCGPRRAVNKAYR
ncbi:hypothetical protein MNBD_ALPHA03-2000, partial [hydrothermal vent metagenome]